MTDTRRKVQAMLNAVREEYPNPDDYLVAQTALCRAIEQHEAFKQEVSDAAREYEEAGYCMGWEGFERFIIRKPKPDPLAGVLEEVFSVSAVSGRINAALEARGLEIRSKK